jgi:uncharacterized protein (DUF924 family)
MKYSDIIDFWFEELTPEQWFKKDPDLDAKICERFSSIHAQAAMVELADWRATPHGALAEIIILDQFSRNIYRDDAMAFASDPLALALAQTAVKLEQDNALRNSQKAFLYMPYMHSESARIHLEAVELFKAAELEQNLKFELMHKEIIDRFGRYPHRNQILGRQSTPEEVEFLKTPGSSF